MWRQAGFASGHFVTLRLSISHDRMTRRCRSIGGNRMRFQTFVATCAAAFLSLPVLATTASAGSALFDSLGGVISSGAYAGWIDPVISTVFNTEATPARVAVAPSQRDY